MLCRPSFIIKVEIAIKANIDGIIVPRQTCMLSETLCEAFFGKISSRIIIETEQNTFTDIINLFNISFLSFAA